MVYKINIYQKHWKYRFSVLVIFLITLTCVSNQTKSSFFPCRIIDFLVVKEFLTHNQNRDVTHTCINAHVVKATS